MAQPEKDPLSLSLTQQVAFTILPNPTHRNLVKLSALNRGTEVLGHDELMDLLAYCVFALRLETRKNYPRSRKYTNMTPRTVWLPENVKKILGSLEKHLQAIRD